MPVQGDWRFCFKCRAMFFDGFSHKGLCPGGAGHNAQGLIFALPHSEPPTATTQVDWRFCDRCNAMFFAGDPNNQGRCPAGGAHHAQGFNFALPHSIPASSTAQGGWRFCDRCHAMFFAGDPNNQGLCPAGGAHHAQGFLFTLPHTGASAGVTMNIWTDSLRCHSETPGFGIGESDEPFALVAVINLERRNNLGIPPTEVVLYGPLNDVDDQENHIFPFRPFWHGPFRPDAAIFLTALLEHDSVNPDLTRTAVAAAVQGVAVATAGADRSRIVSEALSAMSAAAEPVSGPGVVNRLVGPPGEVFFTADDLAAAAAGGEGRRVLRFSSFGDYSVHYLMRRA
jgi:hypothetical protein